MFPSWLFAQSIQTKKDKFSDPDFNNLEEVIRTNDLDSPIRQ
jgi:hypothetical protein